MSGNQSTKSVSKNTSTTPPINTFFSKRPRSQESEVKSIKAKMSGNAELIESFNKMLDQKLGLLENNLSKEIQGLRQENQSLLESLKNSEKIIKQQGLRLNEMENYVKRNNIIIRGLETPKDEDVSERVKTFFEQSLQLPEKVSLNDVRHIGKREASNLIMVSFTSFRDKLSIFRHIRNLKDSGISITDDLTEQSRKMKNKLLKLRYNVRLAAPDTKIVVRRDKLLFNNSTFIWDDSLGLARAEKGGFRPVASIAGVDLTKVIADLQPQGTPLLADVPSEVKKNQAPKKTTDKIKDKIIKKQ